MIPARGLRSPSSALHCSMSSSRARSASMSSLWPTTEKNMRTPVSRRFAKAIIPSNTLGGHAWRMRRRRHRCTSTACGAPRSEPACSASRCAFARAPKTDPMRSRVQLVVEHLARVGVIGLDDEQARVALAQELLLEVRTVQIHVGEPAAVDVVALDVVLQAHELPEEPPRAVRRRLRAVALDRLRGMVRLRGVDAEEPDRLRRAVALHDDRVAVEHPHDAEFLGDRASCLTEPPPQD